MRRRRLPDPLANGPVSSATWQASGFDWGASDEGEGDGARPGGPVGVGSIIDRWAGADLGRGPGDPAETPTSVPATVEPAPGAAAPTTPPAAPPSTASTVAPVRPAPGARAPTSDDDDGKGKRGGKGGD